MKLRCSGYAIIALLLATGHVRAQKWFTPDVAREVGREPCGAAQCTLGRGDEKPVRIGASQITAVTMFVFDTIATYAQGRVVEITTGKSIAGAVIQVQHACHEGCDVKTAVTNQAGFFRLGWVGCHGPKSPTANRPLLIQAAGYQPINTESVRFGGGTYLHIELTAQKELK